MGGMEDKNREDRELVTAAQRNPRAFGRLYSKYQQKLFRFFWHRLHDVDQAADFVQETFLRAFSSLRRFRFRGYSYQAILRRIGLNLLVDYFRKKKTVSLEDVGEIPDDRDERRQLSLEAELLWAKAVRLPPAERRVLELYYRQERSIRDIAATVGKSENAVKLLLSRGRKRLRRLVDKSS